MTILPKVKHRASQDVKLSQFYYLAPTPPLSDSFLGGGSLCLSAKIIWAGEASTKDNISIFLLLLVDVGTPHQPPEIW